MLKFASLIAIVLMTIVLCSDYSGNNMALANLKPVPDLTQLYLIADKLDKGLLDENVRKEPGFKQRVIDFVSLPKGEIVKDQLNKMNAVLDDFQKDANEFIKGYNPNSPFKFFDTNKNKAYSTAKQENGLTKLIDDYKERLDLKLGVTEADISCDLDVFQMTKLHDMLYVLQKDIMYLGAEKPSVIIRAIEDKLKETKYYAKHDQYNNYGATDEQKELMKNLYFSVVIADTKNTLDAVHHYEYPNPLVLGRISDDCSSLLEFAANYDRLNKERVEHCANSEMAKVPKRHPVIRVLKDDFANEMKFCEDYFGSPSAGAISMSVKAARAGQTGRPTGRQLDTHTHTHTNLHTTTAIAIKTD